MPVDILLQKSIRLEVQKDTLYISEFDMVFKFRLCVIYFSIITHNWRNAVLLIMLLPVPIYLVRYKYQEAERQFILSKFFEFAFL